MHILGISCYYHDAAACLQKDGKIVAAAQEERFTRKKHDDSFPVNAITFCLTHVGITSRQLDCVGFYDKKKSFTKRNKTKGGYTLCTIKRSGM